MSCYSSEHNDIQDTPYLVKIVVLCSHDFKPVSLVTYICIESLPNTISSTKMIDLSQWRASIGLWNSCCQAAPIELANGPHCDSISGSCSTTMERYKTFITFFIIIFWPLYNPLTGESIHIQFHNDLLCNNRIS